MTMDRVEDRSRVPSSTGIIDARAPVRMDVGLGVDQSRQHGIGVVEELASRGLGQASRVTTWTSAAARSALLDFTCSAVPDAI